MKIKNYITFTHLEIKNQLASLEEEDVWKLRNETKLNAAKRSFKIVCIKDLFFEL